VTAKSVAAAQPLADQMNCQAGEGWEAVVKRPDIDVVVVCTPPDSHAAITLAAMEHGKHVLCEKPLARTLPEAEAMVRAAKERGLVLKCGFNHRYHPAILKAKEHLDKGMLGRPLFLRSCYGICGRPGYEREWRADLKVVSGGHLMEQGIHVVDLFRWFLGDMAAVSSMMQTSYWPIQPLEDSAFVLFRTAGGAIASLHSSLTQWINLFRFEVYGEEGYAMAESLGGGYGTERFVFGKKSFNEPFRYETTEFRGGDSSWQEEWKEFVSAIEQRREPMGNATDGLEAMRLVFAAYESARSRSEVSLVSGPEGSAGGGQ
jgi:predicted dehydrogenase